MCLGSDRISCAAEKVKLADQVKQEQAEVSILKTQMSDISESHRVEMEHAFSERTQLEEEVQQLRQAAETSEEKARLAQEAAQRFQARIDAWAVEFKKVQDNMHGEANFRDTFFLTFPSLSFFFRTLS